MTRRLLHHMLRLLLACGIGLAFLLSSFMLVQQISAPIKSQHATIALVSTDTPMNDPLAALDDLLVIGVTGIGLASMRRWLLGKPTPSAWKALPPLGYAASPGSVWRSGFSSNIDARNRGRPRQVRQWEIPISLRHLQE